MAELTIEQKRALAVASARKRAAESGDERFTGNRDHGDETGRYGGGVLNATAGINEGIYGTLGAPVDLARGAINMGIRGVNAVAGSELDTIPSDSIGGSEWIGNQLGRVDPVLDPDNTEASTAGERIARGAGQGVGYTIAPEAAVAALIKTGRLSGPVADALTKIFGSGQATASNATVGGASGGGATAAMEAAPEGWEPVAGVAGGIGAGLVAAGGIAGTKAIARAGGRLARDTAAPLTQSGRERLAADQLQESASNPSALRQSLDDNVDELVPGSEPTTFQASGDMGVGGMERGAQARNPELFNQRRADQNAARIKALSGVQDAGAPEAVATAVRQRMQQIDDATNQLVERARMAAQGAADAPGAGKTPETAGAEIRAALEAAREQAKVQERALWSAVDPDGTLALGSSNTKTRAASIMAETPVSAKPPSGEEAAIFSQAGQYGDITPFSEVTALQSRIKAELRAERLANGESPAYRRLSQLNAAVQSDLETAVAGKVAQESDAVARGVMDESQTMLAKLRDEVGDWFGTRQQSEASINGPASPSGTPGARPRAVPGDGGAEVPGGGRFPDAPGNPRLSADDANFDAAALERLNTAREATKARVETFDNKTLGPLRRRPATTSPYDVPNPAVPDRVFVTGPRGFSTVETYRQAVGDPAALEAISDYAVDRLRTTALRPDGTLDPIKVRSFRKRYADALRAFPELDAKFANAEVASETLAAVAKKQKQVLTEAQSGVLGKLMGVDDPQDVKRTIGGIFGTQDSAQKMLRLRNAISGSDDAKVGLRKAVADYMSDRFIGNTEAGTSGVGTMKSDGFQSFVRNNKPALRNAGFSDDEISIFQRVADDLQRANRSIASVKNPGGSNTAQDMLKATQADSGSTVLAKVIANLGVPSVGATGGFVAGGPVGAVVGGIGAGVIAELRRQGLEKIDDILADALLHPARARILLKKATTPKEGEAIVSALVRSFRKMPVVVTAVEMEQMQADQVEPEPAPAPPPQPAPAHVFIPAQQPVEDLSNLTEDDLASPIDNSAISQGKRFMSEGQR
jgi:hypothetical protein